MYDSHAFFVYINTYLLLTCLRREWRAYIIEWICQKLNGSVKTVTLTWGSIVTTTYTLIIMRIVRIVRAMKKMKRMVMSLMTPMIYGAWTNLNKVRMTLWKVGETNNFNIT